MIDKHALIEGYLEWARQEADNSVEAYIAKVELEEDFELMRDALKGLRTQFDQYSIDAITLYELTETVDDILIRAGY